MNSNFSIEMDRLSKEYDKLLTRLENDEFLDNAPSHVVMQTWNKSQTILLQKIQLIHSVEV